MPDDKDKATKAAEKAVEKDADNPITVPATPGFTRGLNENSDDARRRYAETGHDFDKIQSKDEAQTFADGSTVAGPTKGDPAKE